MILVNRHMTLQYRRVELEKGSNGVPVLERPWFFKDTQDYSVTLSADTKWFAKYSS